MIHLAPVRIEAGDDPVALRFFRRLFRQSDQSSDSDHADAARKREPLSDARRNAKAGKRARTRTVGNAVDLSESEPRLGEDFADDDEDPFRLALTGGPMTRKQLRAAARRYRAEIGGGIDRKQIHRRFSEEF
jgi:hypothetical protein